ncbi:S8 family peptidase [Bacillus infantis]|uniref:S8 family peptidase n=1 Tax=Bacillus infantis TaxID=324767 RepID=UPI003CE83E5F
MKKWLMPAAVMLLISNILFPVMSNGGPAAKAGPEKQEANYIAFFNGEINEKLIESAGGEVTREYGLIHAAAVKLPAASAEALRLSGKLAGLVMDQKVQAGGQVIPWAHGNINRTAMQPAGLTGKGVKIAIIDSGAAEHEDLSIAGGACVLDLDYNPLACKDSYKDENGHGTHVAGIIGALDNEIGIVGVAPDAQLYAVKALDRRGDGTSSTVMAGLEWAIKNDMDIINLSLTTPYDDVGIRTMIDKAYEKGILIIAAAGNSGRSGDMNTVEYPGKFPSVIAVAAVNKANVRVPSSSSGAEIELAAPGSSIYSTTPQGYGYMTGTSMASPFAAGMAALYMQKYPGYTNKQIRKLLQTNAKDLGTQGKDHLYGYGLVQADTAKVDPIPVSARTDSSGKISLDMQNVLKEFKSYNVYRFGGLIAEGAAEPVFEDYGVKGQVPYMIVPLNGKEEKLDRSTLVSAEIASPYFKDITNSLWYSRHLIYLNREGILNGYQEKMIGPGKLVTRAEAVAMIGRALGIEGTQKATRFKDVPSASFASGYIEGAAASGILTGFKDGTFRPNEPVTRAEMAILIARGYKLPDASNVSFSDVSPSIAGSKEILKIAGAHISEGYPDGTFKPGEKMLRSSYAVFLARAENKALR